MFGRSELTIDNSADTSLRNTYIRQDSFLRSAVNIKFAENDLTLLKYLGGSGGALIVEDTPQNNALTAKTELVLGAGVDDLVVRRTTSPLTINGNGGADKILIGNNARRTKSMEKLISAIHQSLAETTLTINGENDVNPNRVVIDAGSVQGLAPAVIRFNERDLIGLTVSAGQAENNFRV